MSTMKLPSHKVCERLFKSLGYTIETTTDPKVVRELIREDPNRFDLVVSDMAMPTLIGDQLVTQLRKNRPDLRTIICTGYSAKISKTEVLKVGVKEYIMKPLDKTELAQVVHRVLDDSRST